MKYQIKFIETGELRNFRATDWTSFESDVNDIDLHDYSAYVEFFVEGKQVSFEQAVEVAKQARVAFNEKRSAIKKLVWVRKGGVTNAKSNFHQVWVNK